MLIKYSNFSFLGMGGDLASSLGDGKQILSHQISKWPFLEKIDLVPENF